MITIYSVQSETVVWVSFAFFLYFVVGCIIDNCSSSNNLRKQIQLVLSVVYSMYKNKKLHCTRSE